MSEKDEEEKISAKHFPHSIDNLQAPLEDGTGA